MDTDHRNIDDRLTDVLSEFARTLLTDVSIESILDHLVMRVVEVLPVSGAGVTLIPPDGSPPHISASDDRARGYEQLQGVLNEGPRILASTGREAVVAPTLEHDERFARFSSRAVEQGLAAAFAFPLEAGDHRFGALDLYQTSPGPLDEDIMAAAQTLADVAAAYLLNAQIRIDLQDSLEPSHRSDVQSDGSLEALRDSEARKKGILDAVPDPVITIDQNGVVIEFNPAAERTFGYSRHEALGRELAELIIPEADRDAHREGMRRYLATGESPLLGRRVEMTPLRADGSSFPAEVAIIAVVTAGPPLFTGFVRDLTAQHAADAERQELQNRVHQSERLESLGQLAGGVAHDFNNRLMVILNYASFIIDATPEESPTRAHAEEILASAEQAAALTKQLQTYARREPVRHTAVDLNVVVAEMRTLLERTLGEQVQIEVRTTRDLPPIHADRGQTEQVLTNLSLNARDAMPDGGHLIIETALVESGPGDAGRFLPAGPGPYVRLSVTDTGVGMSAEVAARAFEPFFSTKRSGEGAGLGLATVYGIVTDTGGSVDVQSGEGVGTTFNVYFPSSRETLDSSTTPVDVVGAGETVLVVEDERAVRDVTVAMLFRNGYQVHHAADAKEAVRIAADIDIDLLLTDVVMPGTSGRELVSVLRERQLSCPVLFMSGYSDGAFGSERVLEGGEGFIHKPFKESDLLRAVHDALGRSDNPKRSPQ